MKLRVSCVVGLLLLASCQSTPKQPLKGDLVGVVYDLDKAPVGLASIVLSRDGEQYRATTDAQGKFTIPEIEAGTYTLAFSKGMYESRTWPLKVITFADAVYLQTASYWQLLDAALDAVGRKEWEEARGFLERAKGIQSQTTTSLFLQAVLEEKSGNGEAAIGDINEALTIDAKSPFLWLYLADLYERSGAEKRLQADALERYLELKDDPQAAERLGSLRQDPARTSSPQ